MSDGPYPNPTTNAVYGVDKISDTEFRSGSEFRQGHRDAPEAEAGAPARDDAAPMEEAPANQAPPDEARSEADAPEEAAPADDAPAEAESPDAAPADEPPSPLGGSFAAGTRLATPNGPVAVEDLAIGDQVVTVSGAARPIRWIGRRTVACHGHAELQPVRVAAHAFGEGRPERDLLVAPGHGLCLDVLGEVLIPAGRLVNGTTLARMPLESVAYRHVELDEHDILLAEGLPAESYRDTGDRASFDADAPAPSGLRAVGGDCRPVHEEGVLIEVLRSRLTERAQALGWRLVEEPMAGLYLVVDGQTVHPDSDGLVARFVVSAEAREVRLVSGTSVPAHVLPGSTDDRRLGVALAALTLDDGLTGLRTVALDDPRLETGFHPLDGQGEGQGEARWRWTDGAAVLPAALWEGCRGTLFLRIILSCPALPRWIGPRESAGIVDLAGFRRPH